MAQSLSVFVGIRSKMSRSHWMGESMLLTAASWSPASMLSSSSPSRSVMAAAVTSSASSTFGASLTRWSVLRSSSAQRPVASGEKSGSFVVMPGQAAPGGVERVMRRESVDMGFGDGIERSGGTHETQPIG